ncbi:MAG TPA: hypothetical protein VHD85_19760 [Terracidiphilus sp.]|nr:hypothetical protein [Terracidiphilus sp.]
MSKNYLLKIASASEQGIGMGFYLYAARQIGQKEGLDFACNLAAGATNFLLQREAKGKEQQDFELEHAVRIRNTVSELATRIELREILSGAAYNISYGRYLNAGGGVFFNKFLAYIRAESQVNTSILPFARTLNDISPSILSLILHFRSLFIWIKRDANPNELNYFRAIEKFCENEKKLAGIPA